MAIDNKILTEMEKNLSIGGLIDIVTELYPNVEAAVEVGAFGI